MIWDFYVQEMRTKFSGRNRSTIYLAGQVGAPLNANNFHRPPGLAELTPRRNLALNSLKNTAIPGS
jgi:hypothetical protein